MVGWARLCGVVLVLAPPALAESPRDRMFPDAATCYARVYADAHLAQHPAQRVTRMRLTPDFQFAGPLLGLHVELNLRDVPGGWFEGIGSCENAGSTSLYCTMEGDAGGFTVTPAKDGAVLVSVSELGMSFENARGFATLESAQGDDRNFLLRPSPCQ